MIDGYGSLTVLFSSYCTLYILLKRLGKEQFGWLLTAAFWISIASQEKGETSPLSTE